MVEPLRRRVCEGLEGQVVEIGRSVRAQCPVLPDCRDRRKAAVEPPTWGGSWPGKRLSATSIRCGGGLDGQSLPSRDSFDAAVSTWTLCNIRTSLARCANCGGSSGRRDASTSSSTGWPGQRVRRWHAASSRAEAASPVPLDRPTVEMLTTGRFTIAELDVSTKRAPEPLAADSLGIAVSA